MYIKIKRTRITRRSIFTSLSVIAGSVITSTTVAATVGSLDTTSTGTSHISFQKLNTVIATDISDLYFGMAGSLLETVKESDDVCVFTSTGGYSIKMFSGNGSFVLSDSNTTTNIPYQVDWATSESTSRLTYNSELTGLLGNATALDCNSTPNATMSVSITAPDFNSAEPGSYSDTLILHLRPE